MPASIFDGPFFVLPPPHTLLAYTLAVDFCCHCRCSYVAALDTSTPLVLPKRVFLFCPVAGVAHGLSTHSRLRGDVVMPGFSAAVANGTVDVVTCELLLDEVARPHGVNGFGQ